MNNTSRQKWLSAISALKRKLPCIHPVRVRTVKKVKENWHAWTECDDETITIFIHRKRDIDFMLMLLAHEYGHALDHWHDDTRDLHNSNFAVHANEAYKVVFDTD